jgi:hypothetical protein
VVAVLLVARLVPLPQLRRVLRAQARSAAHHHPAGTDALILSNVY